MLGFIVNARQADLGHLLADLADQLQRTGLRLAGALQKNLDFAPNRPCHMDLAVLGQGAVVRISQDRGFHAKGCRLDLQALAQAVALVEATLDQSAPDVLIVNKFGKSEAEGGGFRAVIGKAIVSGVPVLLTVAPEQLDAFSAFAGDIAQEVPADLSALASWCHAQRQALA